jgi:glucose-1-phosphate thymidylyltransferase
MKGIVLAGEPGVEFAPMTKIISKQIFPIYDKPMIYYPISVLLSASIKDILIISTPEDISLYEKLLGDGKKLGVSFSYKVQESPRGIIDAFIIGEDFIGDDGVCLILGDNVFCGQDLSAVLRNAKSRRVGATILGYPVEDPERFGVVEFGANGEIVSLEEKPRFPKSNYAVPGLYFYDNQVVEIAKKLEKDGKENLGITELNNVYLRKGELNAELIGRGMAWFDVGCPEDFLRASNFVRCIQKTQNYYISCIEEIAWRRGFIGDDELYALGKEQSQVEYGKYIMSLVG